VNKIEGRQGTEMQTAAEMLCLPGTHRLEQSGGSIWRRLLARVVAEKETELVGPAFNPNKDRHACVSLAREAGAFDGFVCQTGEQARSHRICVAMALSEPIDMCALICRHLSVSLAFALVPRESRSPDMLAVLAIVERR
jgi:hypothetical protein